MAEKNGALDFAKLQERGIRRMLHAVARESAQNLLRFGSAQTQRCGKFDHLKAATPITDLRVHQETLSLKLRRAVQDPVVRQVLEDRARERQIKADLLTTAALTDRQLNLPVLNPKMPLEEVLQYRDKHEAALQEARDKLGWMARRIEAEPWDDAFIDELERETIPDIADKLKEVRKARDSWLRSQGGHLALQAAGVK